MSNTLDSALIASKSASKAIPVLSKLLAPLKAFTSDFSDEVVKAQGIINVPVHSVASSTQTDPTSFTAGNNTLTYSPVQLRHYSQIFGLTSKEINQGFALESLVEKNLKTFANKIWQVAITPLKTTSSFSTATVPAASTFVAADMASVWANVEAADKAVVFDFAHYAKLIPTSTTNIDLGMGAYGFENGVYVSNDLSTMQASAVGFVAAPTAICQASGIVEKHGDFLSSELLYLEDIGITVEQNLFYDGNRGLCISYDVAYGASAGDVTAGKILLNA